MSERVEGTGKLGLLGRGRGGELLVRPSSFREMCMG